MDDRIGDAVKAEVRAGEKNLDASVRVSVELGAVDRVKMCIVV